MFDAETVRLISAASPLDGLDLARLPQFLTEAYAMVIRARLDAAAPPGAAQQRVEWDETVVQLRRLADTYEALTIFLREDDPQRDSCAFVAGSAHLALNQIRSLRRGPEHEPSPSLSVHSVSPEVAACLLFLIGGHQADAAEAAKSFAADGASHREQLLAGIACLAAGDGEKIRRFARLQIAPQDTSDGDYVEAAGDALFRQLTRAVQALCRRVLGDQGDDPISLVDAVLARITRAHSSVALWDGPAALRLGVEGPYHVGRLLRAAASVLLGHSVVAVPAPSGIQAASWVAFLQRFAESRPFLWRNHIEATRRGFLEQGQSFALTFPTGAGKTTLTELRIAAEVLRGRDVVFLAPTRALVDQTYRSLSRTLKPLGTGIVKGRLLEDFGERTGAGVYVQTPEQCLAYLSHEPTAHTALGLVVVDECHQLSGAVPTTSAAPVVPQRPPGRRAVDAMWTLLSLLIRSPQADAVLISAMLRNGTAIADWLAVATGRPAVVLDLAWKPTRQIRGVVAYERPTIDALQKTLRDRQGTGLKTRTPTKKETQGIAAVPMGLFCHTQVWDTVSSFAKFPLLSAPVELSVNAWWSLTANRNEVAGRLLAATGTAGIRSIVFTQNLGWTTAIAKIGAADLLARGSVPIDLTENEAALYAAAGEELGADGLVERPAEALVGIHHGLLLLSERIATESAFQRSDGLTALVATPTVAQGINLPAEAVIIAGDDRWGGTPEEGAPETLAVHELLNAAGRAGRAGHFAHGIVVDVPGKVISVEETGTHLALSHLDHIMGLFGSPDQCLDIVDPLTQVLDRVAAGAASEDVSQYLVRRVSGLDDAALTQLLRSALGNARRPDRDDVVAAQAAMLRGLKPNAEATALEEWRELASQSATSPEVLAQAAAGMPSLADATALNFPQLVDFVLAFVLKTPGALFDLVDPGSTDLGRILPRSKNSTTSGEEDVVAWEARASAALEETLPKWLGGATLLDVGTVLRRHRGPKAKAKAIDLARRFAIQTAAGLSHGVSVVCRVMQRKLAISEPSALASWLALVPGCIREGFDDPDKLLLFRHMMNDPGLYPRVLVHRRFAQLHSPMPSWTELFDVDERRYVMRVLWLKP